MDEEQLREVLEMLNDNVAQGISVLDSGEANEVSEERKGNFEGMASPVVVLLLGRYITFAGIVPVINAFIRLMCVAYALGQRDAIEEP